jgi:hypothetical protein
MNSDILKNEKSVHEGGHTFHIPVMGTGFSIDTPLKVAKYGISSVVSLVDDVLIEQVRKFYSEHFGEPYDEITDSDSDHRASRITAYLNLLNRIVQRQVKELQSSPFEKGSEITRYYEMLPENPLKELYHKMCRTSDTAEKTKLQDELRSRALPGSIDVNIMTKLNCVNYHAGKKLSMEFNDAMSALRGYAQSTLCSAIILSAGMNQHLYSYMSNFDDFFPDNHGVLKKKIVLKVSDYRSAMIQGRYLAKKRLWVSEYRIESGLNCGGHTFPTLGLLLGPILDEFKKNRPALEKKLNSVYSKAREANSDSPLDRPQELRVTVQGGIVSTEEQDLLMKCYNVDGTGWGTPFMMATDVVNVDEEHQRKLIDCTGDDVFLSYSSPVGVPYWNLRTSASENKRREHIEANTPGSTCPKAYLRFDDTYAERGLCLASRAYQKLRLSDLESEDITEELREAKKELILAKSCICHDLGGTVKRKLGIDRNADPAICCGPSIKYFSRLTGLEEMVSHIYGRLSLLTSSDRPHMFIQELQLYIEHLRDLIHGCSIGLISKTPKQCEEFAQNLMEGIQYYRNFSLQYLEDQREKFLGDLCALQQQLESLAPAAAAEA